MLIDFIHIQNFRKLKDCRIDFSIKQTVFVGANNSGKTSAMDALVLFLKSKNKFTTRDFTLSNWKSINAIGNEWLEESDPQKIDLAISKWEDYLPTLDIWLNVKNTELHYISHLIPTLDWSGGLLGIRLRFEPLSIDTLYNEFSDTYTRSKVICGTSKKAKGKNPFSLWPKDMWDFLEEKLNNHFVIRTYLLDPKQSGTNQKLSATDLPLDGDAFKGLIKIDVINAQRGFSDVNTESSAGLTHERSLSTQLRGYYDKHLNPSVNPTIDDLKALQAIHDAKELFDQNLKESFKTSLGELEELNYPGFGNPKITLSSKFNTLDSLNHDSSVQYLLNDGSSDLSLPEKYNGLGYQNLISMIFKLIRFRDEWMQVGKSLSTSNTELGYEPLHLVLIEEPEAHLHAQVQQVFIREAYNVLRRHPELGDKTTFSSQLVLSTHSSHVAHEIPFTSLRYFKREMNSTHKIQTSNIVNLSKTFGEEDETTKFSIRYLKTTHCDIFFADAVILVEGPAERMLVPYFIKKHTQLNNCYISILEIGGSHAHRLKSLLENIGVITLIITDIDSINPSDKNKKVRPEISKGYFSGNDTLKSWIPKEDDLDKLLSLNGLDMEHKRVPIRVAYQIPVGIKEGKKEISVVPYTFEDSLVLENKAIFQKLNGAGLLKKMIEGAKETNTQKAAGMMFESITATGAKKAEFALNLLFLEELDKICAPQYIMEGLNWIESKLISESKDSTNTKMS